MRNLHRRFDYYYIGQIYGRDFAKNCGLLRISKLLRKIYVLGFLILNLFKKVLPEMEENKTLTRLILFVIPGHNNNRHKTGIHNHCLMDVKLSLIDGDCLDIQIKCVHRWQ